MDGRWRGPRAEPTGLKDLHWAEMTREMSGHVDSIKARKAGEFDSENDIFANKSD